MLVKHPEKIEFYIPDLRSNAAWEEPVLTKKSKIGDVRHIDLITIAGTDAAFREWSKHHKSLIEALHDSYSDMILKVPFNTVTENENKLDNKLNTKQGISISASEFGAFLVSISLLNCILLFSQPRLGVLCSLILLLCGFALILMNKAHKNAGNHRAP